MFRENRLSKACGLGVCALLAVCAQCLAPAKTASQPPRGNAAQDTAAPYIISKEVRLVVVPVVVSDKNGHFVSGLKAPNFRLYDNGRLQEIVLFRDEDVPVTAGLVVDHSGSMAAWRPEVIQGARAFVQASNRQDREFVVNFAESVALGLPPNVPFTGNVKMLEDALSRAPAGGRTALYDAIAVALQHLPSGGDEKRVLILISDGGDTASSRNFKDVMRMAQAANVIIYAIGLLDEHSADQNPGVLRNLAKETGGQAYFPNSASEVVDVCKAIASDIRQQYTLAYNPPVDAPSGFRKIHVSVSAPGRGKISVRSRTGYFLASKT